MILTTNIWQLIGFSTTCILGVLLHFLYERTNIILISPFSCVNESTWEHMKIAFWPMLICSIIQSFYFKDREKLHLQDVNFRIESGQTVGILGGTGSSKSTLVQLIPRLYDVTEGSVYVGGIISYTNQVKNMLLDVPLEILDQYGAVLGERHSTLLDYYYNQDLSLAEIAAEVGISRQGVRDSINKAEEELFFLYSQ